MKIIDQATLSQLSAAARANPRRRKNLNLHPSDDFCCHRFFNAIEPDSYIRPHRHMAPDKDETIIIMSGALGVIQFEDDGSIANKAILVPGGPALAVDIPSSRFHSAVSLTSGTVFFEAKAGPYRELAPEETPSWAPEQGSPEAHAYLQKLVARLLE